MADGDDKIFVISSDKPAEKPKVVRPTGGPKRASKPIEITAEELKELEPIVIDASDASFSGKTVKERQQARAELDRLVQETIEKKKRSVMTERGIDPDADTPLPFKRNKPLPECLEKIDEFVPLKSEGEAQKTVKNDLKADIKAVDTVKSPALRQDKPVDAELAAKLKAYAILNMAPTAPKEASNQLNKVVDSLLRVVLFPFYKGKYKKKKSGGIMGSSADSTPVDMDIKRRDLQAIADRAVLDKREKERKEAAINAELLKERKERVVADLDPSSAKGVEVSTSPVAVKPIAKEDKAKVRKIDDTDFII